MQDDQPTYPYTMNTVNMLSIILDCNSNTWKNTNRSINFPHLLESLFVFINTYFILDNTNMISIFAATSSASYLLAPKLAHQQDYQQIKQQILNNLKEYNILSNEEGNL